MTWRDIQSWFAYLCVPFEFGGVMQATVNGAPTLTWEYLTAGCAVTLVGYCMFGLLAWKSGKA